MMPDPAFIADRRDRLVGLVITHAHEDHIGAVAMAVAATALPGLRHALRRRRVAPQAGRSAAGRPGEAARHPARRGDRPEAVLGCASCASSHSIPEAQALAITTPHGVVLHTGDWKLDPRSADRPADRRGRSGRRWARGRAGDDLRFHQRDGGGAFRQRGRSAAKLVGADARPARARRGDMFRQQRGARGIGRAGRAGGRAQRGAGRPHACATSRQRRANAAI